VGGDGNQPVRTDGETLQLAVVQPVAKQQLVRGAVIWVHVPFEEDGRLHRPTGVRLAEVTLELIDVLSVVGTLAAADQRILLGQRRPLMGLVGAAWPAPAESVGGVEQVVVHRAEGLHHVGEQVVEQGCPDGGR
jgi:hypothetical protein